MLPASRIMALESTQSLTETSISTISCGGKDGRCVGSKHYHFRMPIVLKSVSLNLLDPTEPVQACTGLPLHLPPTESCSESRGSELLYTSSLLSSVHFLLRMMHRQIQDNIIHVIICVLIHSSLYVMNDTFPNCRPNFAEVACVTCQAVGSALCKCP